MKLIGLMAQAEIVFRFVHERLWPDRLLILMYHMIVPELPPLRDWCMVEAAAFRRQMAYLKRHFDVMPLDKAVTDCLEGRLKRPTAAVTFDDGYQNNFEAAFPVLRAEHIPATIFLTTGLACTSATGWPGRLHAALLQSKLPCVECNGKRLAIGNDAQKSSTFRILQAEFKRLPPSLLQFRVREMLQLLGSDPADPVAEGSPYRMLDWHSIQEMKQSGIVSFGAHTHTHPILSHLSENDQLEEIMTSLEHVETLTGNACRCFAYPNGRRQDYSPATVELLRRCRVEQAVTTIAGFNKKSTPALQLLRIGVGSSWDMNSFRIAVHPGLTLLHRHLW